MPGNPFKMDDSAKAVDNVGTVALIDAAKAAGVKKVVLVSSILTDAESWGQLESAGYKITNAFGKVRRLTIPSSSHRLPHTPSISLVPACP